ncbi:hypothetical protein ACS0TY_013248 [Phlomoides rotata]
MKMTALRKDLMCLFLKNSSYLYKSRVSFSLPPFHYYSTSNEEKPPINPEVYDFFRHKHHFSPESASKAASVLPYLRNPGKSDSIISFFRETGFSNTHLEKIVKYKPAFITSNLEKTLKPKIKILQDLGISNDDIADIFANNASVLFRSLNNRVLPALSVLRGLLGSDGEVIKLLKRSAWFIGNDLEKSVVPNVEFFKNKSVPMISIIRCLHNFPRFFLQKPEYVRKYAKKAEEMGATPTSNMYIYAVRIVGSMCDEVWERKLQTLRNLGFSEEDILNALRKYPLCFGVSVKKMKKVKEILVSSGKYDSACIATHPLILLFSIEKRYKPRLQVLAALERKNLIKEWPSITILTCISNKDFFKRYVLPYVDEVGDLDLSSWEKRG